MLATGNTLLVDEVSESSDGYWYKRGNITTFLDRERVTRIDHPKPEGEAATRRRTLKANGRSPKQRKSSSFSSRSSSGRCRSQPSDNQIYTHAGDWTTATEWTLACIPTALKDAH